MLMIRSQAMLGELRQLRYPAKMFYAFLDGRPVDLFAFLLVYGGVVLYPHYGVPGQLGISALSDQEAGGAMMWARGVIDLRVMSPLFFEVVGDD